MSDKPILPLVKHETTVQEVSQINVNIENIDAEEIVVLNTMINKLKTIPIRMEELIPPIIKDLDEEKHLFNKNSQHFIEKYINFLSSQTFESVSFSCKECIMQDNIHSIFKKLSETPESKMVDIDFVKEYEKYITRDPQENNVLFMKFFNSDIFEDILNLFIIEDNESQNIGKSTKIEELNGGGYDRRGKAIGNFFRFVTAIPRNVTNIVVNTVKAVTTVKYSDIEEKANDALLMSEVLLSISKNYVLNTPSFLDTLINKPRRHKSTAILNFYDATEIVVLTHMKTVLKSITKLHKFFISITEKDILFGAFLLATGMALSTVYMCVLPTQINNKQNDKRH